MFRVTPSKTSKNTVSENNYEDSGGIYFLNF